MKLIRVGESHDIYWFTYGKLKQNCYVIKNIKANACLVIDPGTPLKNFIDNPIFSDVMVDGVLATHGHYDHIQFASEYSSHFNLPLFIHKNDVYLMKRASLFSIPIEKTSVKPVDKIETNFSIFRSGAFPKLKAHHMMGHTSGSMIFEFDKFLVSGDTILMNDNFPKMPGFDGYELETTYEAIGKKFKPSTLIFPGHGAPFRLKKWNEQNRKN